MIAFARERLDRFCAPKALIAFARLRPFGKEMKNEKSTKCFG
jgi:hypothetical protein